MKIWRRVLLVESTNFMTLVTWWWLLFYCPSFSWWVPTTTKFEQFLAIQAGRWVIGTIVSNMMENKCPTGIEFAWHVIWPSIVIISCQRSLPFFSCCIWYRDLDEVIRRANNTRYGLAAGVFTSNIDTANTLTRALRVGTVWINCFDVFDAAIPFGGFKMSGNGREKGIYSLSNYLQVKAVVTPLKNPAWLWSY